MKKCNICNVEKNLDNFVKRANRPSGVQAYCKDCHNAKTRLKDNSYHNRKSSLKKAYGITIDDYNRMFAKQNGCCAICKTHITQLNQPRKKYLCVDHDHHTGKIRGLLCDKCNRGIGLLQDNKEIVSNAYHYLNRF